MPEEPNPLDAKGHLKAAIFLIRTLCDAADIDLEETCIKIKVDGETLAEQPVSVLLAEWESHT